LRLADAISDHANAVSQLDSLQNNHLRVLKGVGSGRRCIVRLSELRAVERQDIQYRETEKTLSSQVDSLVQQIVDQRTRLVEAQQEVAKLEKLQAARLAKHQSQVTRIAQQRFDEQASVAFQRRCA
jgi:flagellar export protein FliJ